MNNVEILLKDLNMTEEELIAMAISAGMSRRTWEVYSYQCDGVDFADLARFASLVVAKALKKEV